MGCPCWSLKVGTEKREAHLRTHAQTWERQVCANLSQGESPPSGGQRRRHHRDVIWLHLVAHFIALRLELHLAPVSQQFAVVGELNGIWVGAGSPG